MEYLFLRGCFDAQTMDEARAHGLQILETIHLPSSPYLCYIPYMIQTTALRILASGANVFLTGAAGSGKTHLLRAFLRYADDTKKTVAITASTGIAATHMGGMTIHSWAGIGITDDLSDKDIARISADSKLQKRFRDTDVLIIDEISMLHYARIDTVDLVLRKARNSSSPFGGIQVVLCGDFFQLPPVVRDHQGMAAPFAYRAKVWKTAEFQICYLSEQFRQTDVSMTRILNEIRAGHVSPASRAALNARVGAVITSGSGSGLVTRLYAQNIDVDKINDRHLSELPGEARSYRMLTSGPASRVESLQKNCLAPAVLSLKTGARVMFVRNDPTGRYVNGTVGIVESFDAVGGPIVRTSLGRTVSPDMETWSQSDGDTTLASITQYPLRLAWAITIHKSQGMSLDAAEIDLRNAFVKGMGYVALSRVRSLEGLSLVGINNLALAVDDEAHRVDAYFRARSDEAAARAVMIVNPSDEDIQRFLAGATRREAQERASRVRAGKEPRAPREQKARSEPKIVKPKTHLFTRELFTQGKNIDEIAESRGLTLDTIIGHFELCLEEDIQFDIQKMEKELPPARLKAVLAAIDAEGPEKLSPIKHALPADYTWDEIKLGRLIYKAKQK